MQKYKHPKNKQTLIIFKDQSTLITSWIFLKKKLKLNFDFLKWIQKN